jgi:hypothetical protein
VPVGHEACSKNVSFRMSSLDSFRLFHIVSGGKITLISLGKLDAKRA